MSAIDESCEQRGLLFKQIRQVSEYDKTAWYYALYHPAAVGIEGQALREQLASYWREVAKEATRLAQEWEGKQVA